MIAWLLACGGSGEAPDPPATGSAGSAGPNGSRVFTAAEVRALPKRTTRVDVGGTCVTFEGASVGDAFGAAGVDESVVRARTFAVVTGEAATVGAPTSAFAAVASAGCGDSERWALLAWGREGEAPDGLRYVLPGPPDLVLEGAHVLALGGVPEDLAAFAGVRQSGGLAVVGAEVP